MPTLAVIRYLGFTVDANLLVGADVLSGVLHLVDVYITFCTGSHMYYATHLTTRITKSLVHGSTCPCYIKNRLQEHYVQNI